MNNTFSFKRFEYLLREILAEKKVFFLGLFVALVSMHVIIGFAFGFPNAYADLRREAIFSICSLIGTFAIALTVTKRFSDSLGSIRSFLLPVSHVEKWLSILFLYIGFLLVHTILFKITDSVLLVIMKSYINSLNLDTITAEEALKELIPFEITSDTSRSVSLFATLLIAWLLTASTYFSKNKLVLSLFTALAVFFVLYVANWGINYIFFGIPNGLDHHVPFTSSSFEIVNDESGTINYIRLVLDNNSRLLLNYIIPLITAFLFIIYYFRLKETEI